MCDSEVFIKDIVRTDVLIYALLHLFRPNTIQRRTACEAVLPAVKLTALKLADHASSPVPRGGGKLCVAAFLALCKVVQTTWRNALIYTLVVRKSSVQLFIGATILLESRILFVTNIGSYSLAINDVGAKHVGPVDGVQASTREELLTAKFLRSDILKDAGCLSVDESGDSFEASMIKEGSAFEDCSTTVCSFDWVVD